MVFFKPTVTVISLDVVGFLWGAMVSVVGSSFSINSRADRTSSVD
jgi:hypothetical protein